MAGDERGLPATVNSAPVERRQRGSCWEQAYFHMFLFERGITSGGISVRSQGSSPG